MGGASLGKTVHSRESAGFAVHKYAAAGGGDVELNESSDGAVTIIAVKGRLDSVTAPTLGERLSSTLGAPSRRLLIELSQLEYISSAGFRILLLAAKRAAESNGQIVLAGVSGKVRQLFDLGGFLDLFRICGTRDEGVAALR
jgi:anti-anti-sigma factor